MIAIRRGCARRVIVGHPRRAEGWVGAARTFAPFLTRLAYGSAPSSLRKSAGTSFVLAGLMSSAFRRSVNDVSGTKCQRCVQSLPDAAPPS